jgi:hypothetical protein
MGGRLALGVYALTLGALLAVLLVGTDMAVSGCGEGVAEKAIEEAAKKNGQDVNVDINSKDGSVSVSSKDGSVALQTGQGVALPDGFPAGLLPDGAKLLSAMTSTQNGSPAAVVVFESSTNDKDTYEFFLQALPKAGYEVTDKVRMESGDSGNAIGIQAKKADSTVVISGGGKTGDKYTYTIMVQTP